MNGVDEGYVTPARGAVAAEVREIVADQLHDLVLEREALGSHTEVVEGVQQLGRVGRQLAQARGRQAQAQEMGLPLAPAVQAELDALALLRSAVMALGAACGAWVTAMDFEARAGTLVAVNGRRRGGDEVI